MVSSASWGGWGGLGLRCRSWAILTEPGSASVTFFLAEVAVVSWRGAVLTFGNAVDARVRAAALCADCLVGTAAGRVAIALTVVALPGTRLRRGRGRCLCYVVAALGRLPGWGSVWLVSCDRRRRLFRLAVAVFQSSSGVLFGCRGRLGQTPVFRGRGRWGRQLVLFP